MKLPAPPLSRVKRPAFAILTDEPNELVASYHDRMPLALADDKVELWLDLFAGVAARPGPAAGHQGICRASNGSRAMNNARQKNLAAIDPQAKAT
jgi:putative SOS response-associated peptidase YedK